jgi:DNA damage-binding protein 1
MRWNPSNSSLETLSTHHGHVLALQLSIRGEFILVGDLMKSITILSYDPETMKLTEIARDHDNNWMTAVEAIDDEVYIGAENNYNLFSLRKNSDSTCDDESKRLTATGAFYLGDLVNRFRKGVSIEIFLY